MVDDGSVWIISEDQLVRHSRGADGVPSVQSLPVTFKEEVKLAVMSVTNSPFAIFVVEQGENHATDVRCPLVQELLQPSGMKTLCKTVEIWNEPVSKDSIDILFYNVNSDGTDFIEKIGENRHALSRPDLNSGAEIGIKGTYLGTDLGFQYIFTDDAADTTVI